MKWTSILSLSVLAAALAAPVAAQTPDTTEARRYLPLDVGNVWEYESWVEDCPVIWDLCESFIVGYTRRAVVAKSVVSDTTYAVIRETSISLSGEPGEPHEYLVRYDAAERRGFRRHEHGEEGWPDYLGPFPCPLDAPFETEITCGPLWGDIYVYEPWEVNVSVGGAAETRQVKHYQSLVPGWMFLPDIGVFYSGGAEFGGAWIRLTYGRAGEVEYGSEQFPVSSESAPPEAAVALSVFPNPMHAAATLRFSLDAPQRLALAVYDVLGRRVLGRDLGVQPAGEASHRLDLAALPVGLYVVRLTGDAGAQATTRLVRH